MTAMTRNRRQAILRQAAGYVELAELLVDGDRPTPETSRVLLVRAIETLGELPEPTRSMPDAKLLEAEALRAMGQWKDAIGPFELVVDAEPQRLEAWLGLGWCFKRLGRLPKAIKVLEQGLTAAPDQPILHYNLACYLSLGGDVQAAIEHLTKAISIDKRFRDLTQIEPDFDPIRSDPRFLAVTHLTV